jgi:AbrB family looped-hinge helix DNA binding protein
MRTDTGCCKVDAVVTVDSKGQIVLPKDVREKAKMKPGDKLALVACECDGETCCIVMVRAEKLGDSVSKMLGPMLKGILKQGDGPNERGEN